MVPDFADVSTFLLLDQQKQRNLVTYVYPSLDGKIAFLSKKD